MDNQEKILFKFLEDLGCKEHPHGDKTLYDHLVGTYQILLEKEAPLETALAGLFHAVYGTTSYPIAVVQHDDREKIQLLIGEEAEELAFLFGTSELPRLEHLEKCADPQKRAALLMIHEANALETEQLPDNVIPLRPRQDPDCELVKVSIDDVYDDFFKRNESFNSRSSYVHVAKKLGGQDGVGRRHFYRGRGCKSGDLSRNAFLSSKLRL